MKYISTLNKQKCLFLKTEQEGKTGPAWGLVPVFGGWGRIKERV
jgi:hypothetical protein